MNTKKRIPYNYFRNISLFVMISLLVIIFYFYHNILISYIISINITTFLLYGYDKKISSTNKIRVPEKILHMLEIFGGTPAALLAQKFFRHKTIKKSYQIKFWAIFIIQFIIIILVIKNK